MESRYDIIVVGAGHAGIEAALISKKFGLKTLLVTSKKNTAGVMSCNPSIGGLGKGHIVKEIDVLGGAMPKITDRSAIQFKKLNARKGPAVRGSRAQCDKWIYAAEAQKLLHETLGDDFFEGDVKELLINEKQIEGLKLADGSEIKAKAVIITAGTFMRGVLHIGHKRIDGGRVGEKPSIGLSDQLRSLGVSVFRLKTGTPPRLKGSSINWDLLDKEYGDSNYQPFHFMNPRRFPLQKISCSISYTNEKTHELIRKNLSESPLFSGAIEGLGPRYCPSIEDKVTRFADKDRHQTFLEPEGIGADSIYLQGISTSLPEHIQVEFLRTIRGLENVELIKPGYAVEYDFIEPTQLHSSLETKFLEGLYLAGQVNGTSGYEEAAGQGLLAGVNASLKILKKEPFILPRYKAYIGVLIDDLITKGTKEPYRMLTSRAEYRLLLREDNVFERLFAYSKKLDLLNIKEKEHIEGVLRQRSKVLNLLETTKLSPTLESQEYLSSLGTVAMKKQTSLATLLKRAEIDIRSFDQWGLSDYDYKDILYPAQVNVKYEGYIANDLKRIEKVKKLETLRIPRDFDYSSISGLSSEEIEKLSAVRPYHLAQAKQISGVNPSAIQYLAIHLSKK